LLLGGCGASSTRISAQGDADTGQPAEPTSATVRDRALFDASATSICEASIQREAASLKEAGSMPLERVLVAAFDATTTQAVDWYQRDLRANAPTGVPAPELVARGEQIRRSHQDSPAKSAVCWIDGEYQYPGRRRGNDGRLRSVQLIFDDGTVEGLTALKPGTAITRP
jgi:hypothetical protein